MMKPRKGEILMPWERLIAIVITGISAGVSPRYSVKEISKDANGDGILTKSEIEIIKRERDEYQKALDKIHTHNADGSVFSETMFYYLVTGASHEILFETSENSNSEPPETISDINNQIEYATLESTSSIVIHDFSIKKKIVANIIEHVEDDKRRIEIYTDKWRRQYDENGNIVPYENGKTELLHYWGDVPVVAVIERTETAIFEPVKDLVDMSESLMTNTRNITQYNDADTKLIIDGYRPVNPEMITDENGRMIANPAYVEEVNHYLGAKALFIVDGKIKWLKKDLDYKGIIDMLNKIEDIIHMMTPMPNTQDKHYGGNQSGISTRFKMFAPEQMGSTIFAQFKAAYTRRLELITKRINFNNAARGNPTNYDHRNVDIIFEANMPSDELEKFRIALDSHRYKLLSHQTCIENSGQVVYIADEMARLEAERSYDLPPVDVRGATSFQAVRPQNQNVEGE